MPLPSPAAQPTPTRSIVLLAVAGFASQAQVRVTDSLLPQIAGDFGTTVGAAAMVVTAYAVAHGSVQLFIGPIGDRFGKYLTVMTMCLASSILVMACGLANSLTELAIARLLAGACAGWVIPLSMAYVGDVTPYDRRQPVLGRYLTGQITGQLFGQAAGGVLGDLFGWRNVFFILGAMFALATAGPDLRADRQSAHAPGRTARRSARAALSPTTGPCCRARGRGSSSSRCSSRRPSAGAPSPMSAPISTSASG